MTSEGYSLVRRLTRCR